MQQDPVRRRGIGHDRVVDTTMMDGLEDGLRTGQGDGRVRRGIGAPIRIYPRGTGRLCAPLDRANAAIASALGHAIGASAARVLATLIAALHNRGLKRGVASRCIGGGETTALALELD